MNKYLTFGAMLLLAVAGGIILTSTQSTEAFGGEGKLFGDKSEIRTAVDANDYSLLSSTAQEKITEEKFSTMVEQKEMKEAAKGELETIVKANDFEAFKTFHETMKAKKEAFKNEKIEQKLLEATEEEKAKILERKASKDEKRAEKGEKTEEEMKEKFDSMVAEYNETGELPQMKRGKRGGEGCSGKRGERGGRGERGNRGERGEKTIEA